MLNRSVIEGLAERHLNVVRDHYRNNQTSRDRVFENLNALAITVATILAAADDSAQAFFNEALERQIDDTLENTS